MGDGRGYYRLVRRTDPSYTVRDAIEEYVRSHPEKAIDLARQMDLLGMPSHNGPVGSTGWGQYCD